jgi:excinuclease UvrABC ATPase subunit
MVPAEWLSGRTRLKIRAAGAARHDGVNQADDLATPLPLVYEWLAEAYGEGFLVGSTRRGGAGGTTDHRLEQSGEHGDRNGGSRGSAAGPAPDLRVLSVIGARTHNLRDISVDIPLECCVLFVGPSGSGKTSLAFGTIHAAAHAAYLEGISSYSRFTETRLSTPDVDALHGLRPTIALAQGYGGRSSRSTVGTVTDALALLRLLFSRLGQPVRTASQLSFNNPEGACPVCKGAGTALIPVDSRLLDDTRTLRQGAMQHRAWKVGGRYWNILEATGEVPLDTKVSELSAAQREFLLSSPAFEVTNRTPGFVQRFTYEGMIPRLEKRVGDARDLSSRSYDLSFF